MQVNHKALAEQVEKEREKQARDKAEAEKQAKQAQPRVPGSTGSKVPRRKKRPTKKEQAEAVTSSLPAIKTGSCEEELPIPKVVLSVLHFNKSGLSHDCNSCAFVLQIGRAPA